MSVLKKILNQIRSKLAWSIAREDLQELERWRVYHRQYRQWLAEFKPIGMVLDNLEMEVKGGRSRDVCTPPGTEGPWDISGLRYNLRFKTGIIRQDHELRT